MVWVYSPGQYLKLFHLVTDGQNIHLLLYIDGWVITHVIALKAVSHAVNSHAKKRHKPMY